MSLWYEVRRSLWGAGHVLATPPHIHCSTTPIFVLCSDKVCSIVSQLELEMIRLIILSVVLAVIPTVYSQTVEFTAGRSDVGNCQRPDEATIAALIPESFDLGDGDSRPTVDISGMMVVCESTGLLRNTINSFSVIVSYNCTGITGCDGTLRTEQFQYDCNSDDTFAEALILGGDLRTQSPSGTLMTPLNVECGRCVESGGDVPSNMDDHCAGNVDLAYIARKRFVVLCCYTIVNSAKGQLSE